MNHIKQAKKALKKGDSNLALAHAVTAIAEDFHEAWEVAKEEDGRDATAGESVASKVESS